MDTFLTPVEAAAYLKLSIETVRRRLRDGTLPSIKIGSKWRISVEALSEQAKAGIVPVEVQRTARRRNVYVPLAITRRGKLA